MRKIRPARRLRRPGIGACKRLSQEVRPLLRRTPAVSHRRALSRQARFRHPAAAMERMIGVREHCRPLKGKWAEKERARVRTTRDGETRDSGV